MGTIETKVRAMQVDADEALEWDVQTAEFRLVEIWAGLENRLRDQFRKALATAQAEPASVDKGDLWRVFKCTAAGQALQAVKLFSVKFGNGEYGRLIDELYDNAGCDRCGTYDRVAGSRYCDPCREIEDEGGS